jgi:hypothetical protein
MKRIPLSILVALLVIQPGLAQASTPETVAVDPSGDVAGATPESSDAGDLTALYLQEFSGNWEFSIEVADLSGTTPLTDNAFYFLYITYLNADYRIKVERIQPLNAGETDYFAMFQKWSGVQQEYVDQELEVLVEADSENSWMTFGIPFEVIEGSDGWPVAAGQKLTDIYVDSTNEAGSASTPQGVYYDRMPDTGVVEWSITEANSQGASFFASMPASLRYTNGGVVTFAFEIIASNGGTETLELQYEATNIPDSWTVEFINPVLALEPQEAVTNVAIIKGTTGHDHGSAETFPISVRTLDGSEVVELEATIVFTETPQPAGHHPMLWLHSVEVEPGALPREALEASGSNYVAFFMNTLEEDDRDIGRSADSQNYGDFEGFRIQLDPDLGIGLDFDVSQPSHYNLGFQPNTPQAPLEGFSLSGAIVVGKDGTYTTIATLSEQAAMTLEGQVWVEGAITPTPAGDLVPFEDGNELYLELYVEFSNQDSNPNWPEILPGGDILLPLVEYEDPLPLVSSNLEIETPAELLANPGLPGTFPLTIKNIATEDIEATIQFLGVDETWGLTATPNSIQIGAGTSQQINVELDIPVDLTVDDVMEFFVVVRDVQGGDPAIQAISIDLTLDANANVTGQQVQESPGPAMVPALALLALAVLAFRRQR